MEKDVDKHIEECPFTYQAINQIPGVVNAFFSILKPGVHIPPHRGPYAGILRYHLGVKIPSGDVGIRIGNINCKWEEGKSLFLMIVLIMKHGIILMKLEQYYLWI